MVSRPVFVLTATFAILLASVLVWRFLFYVPNVPEPQQEAVGRRREEGLKNSSSQVAENEWMLVWSEEFDGSQLNKSRWTYDTGCDGFGNHELQCYTEDRQENVRVADGQLIIQARTEPEYRQGFTSGRIKTKLGWTFGRFEVRARLASGHHLWPAIWMLPLANEYGTWAANGEIDIVESRGDTPTKVSGTAHFGGQWPNNIFSSSGDREFNNTDFSADFHRFQIEWSPTKIHWLIDDVKYFTLDIDRSMWSGRGLNPYTKKRQPFDKPFFFIVNLAVGGNFFGPGPYVTPVMAKHWLKPTLEVDYFRVYQQSKLNETS